MMKSENSLTSRQQKAHETRRKILESALELFREKGFESVSIDDITLKAGTAKGSFYTYFQTKSDIIAEEFRLIDDYYVKKQKAIFSCPTTRERLTAFTLYQLKFIKKNFGYQTISVLYQNQLYLNTNQKVLIDTDRPLVSVVTNILREGQEHDEIRKDISAEELAIYLNRSMRGFFLDWGISRGKIDIIKEGMLYFTKFILPSLLNLETGQSTASDPVSEE